MSRKGVVSVSNMMRENAGSKHFSGINIGAPGGSPDIVAWHRDITRCYPTFMLEATERCMELYKGDSHAYEILDTLSQFRIKAWQEALKDNLGGMDVMRQMLEYVESEGELGAKVHTSFCGFVDLALFGFMFGNRSMAIGTRGDLTLDNKVHAALMSVLACLDKETRNAVVTQMKAAGEWPASVSSVELRQAVDEYIDIIKDDQRKRYAAGDRDSK